MRKEIKYILDEAEYLVLRDRIKNFTEFDKNSVSEDGYNIRSLYFDDVYDTAYYEKYEGRDPRKKYRIRAYNGDTSFISLECKEKIRDLTNKRSARITEKVCDSLSKGDFSVISDGKTDVEKEMYILSKEKGLRPVILIDYQRESYIYPVSNVRITFDKNITCTIGTTDLFGKGNTYNILDKGKVIMEVKYDEYIPAMLSLLLRNIHKPTSFSKYVECRDFVKKINKGYAERI